MENDIFEILEAAELAEAMPETSAEVAVPVDNFLEKPFAEYTTTEGLLLFILLALFVGGIWNAVKEGFRWL